LKYGIACEQRVLLKEESLAKLDNIVKCTFNGLGGQEVAIAREELCQAATWFHSTNKKIANKHQLSKLDVSCEQKNYK
jgi:hypothetical protein